MPAIRSRGREPRPEVLRSHPIPEDVRESVYRVQAGGYFSLSLFFDSDS